MGQGESAPEDPNAAARGAVDPNANAAADQSLVPAGATDGTTAPAKAGGVEPGTVATPTTTLPSPSLMGPPSGPQSMPVMPAAQPVAASPAVPATAAPTSTTVAPTTAASAAPVAAATSAPAASSTVAPAAVAAAPVPAAASTFAPVTAAPAPLPAVAVAVPVAAAPAPVPAASTAAVPVAAAAPQPTAVAVAPALPVALPVAVPAVAVAVPTATAVAAAPTGAQPPVATPVVASADPASQYTAVGLTATANSYLSGVTSLPVVSQAISIASYLAPTALPAVNAADGAAADAKRPAAAGGAGPDPSAPVQSAFEQRELALWHGLVEWVSNVKGALPSGMVLRWHQSTVAGLVLSTSVADVVPARALQLKRAKAKRAKAVTAAVAAVASGSPAAPAPESPKSPFEYDVPYALAEQLLTRDTALVQLRHRLVPARVNEDMFWRLYFDEIITRIVAHVKSLD